MAQTYDFTVKRGDTWDGVNFELKKNNVPIDLTYSTIRAHFCRFNGGKVSSIVALPMTTDNGKIQIVDAAAGMIKFSEQAIDIEPGAYKYDCEVHFNNGPRKTYFEGTLTVVADITR